MAMAPGALTDPYWPTQQYGYGAGSLVPTAVNQLQPLLRAQRNEMRR